MRVRRPTWRSTRPVRPAPRAVDQAVQTLGGNGLASEYGLGALIAASKLSLIAPVSREMILNFVAQHSLGLPKSY